MTFFILRRPQPWSATRADYITAEPLRLGDAPACEACGRFTGMREWLPPRFAELEGWGREWADVAFGAGRELLISARMAKQAERDGITGLHVGSPVAITRTRAHGKRLDAPPTYHYARVMPGTAAVDDLASGVDRGQGPKCPVCRQGGLLNGIQRLMLEEVLEPQPDMFIARGLPGTIIGSTAVLEWMTANGFTGVEPVTGDGR